MSENPQILAIPQQSPDPSSHIQKYLASLPLNGNPGLAEISVPGPLEPLTSGLHDSSSQSKGDGRVLTRLELREKLERRKRKRISKEGMLEDNAGTEGFAGYSSRGVLRSREEPLDPEGRNEGPAFAAQASRSGPATTAQAERSGAQSRPTSHPDYRRLPSPPRPRLPPGAGSRKRSPIPEHDQDGPSESESVARTSVCSSTNDLSTDARIRSICPEASAKREGCDS
jgi:hypothetical protein